MELNVRDAAALLRVSMKTIYRWIGSGKIPGYRVSNSFRFDRTELLEWATENRIEVTPALMQVPVDVQPIPRFDEALMAGGIHFRVEGGDRDAVLTNVVRLMRLQFEAERDLVFAALRAREDLASTAIGDGLALPHLRNPLRFHFERPAVTLCFLERPVDWHALDHQPVSALLVAVGATVRAVLQLHSRAFFALRDPAFRAAITEQQSREAIRGAAQRVTDAFGGTADADLAPLGRLA